jgi:acyl-CoA-binding protein
MARSSDSDHGNRGGESTSTSWLPFGGLVIATVSVTIMVSAASYAYVRYQRDRISKTPSSSSASSRSIKGTGNGVSLGLDDKFSIAADRVRSLRNISTKERLVLYALYKQATIGDAPSTYDSSQNGAFVSAMQDHAKWDAWSRLHGMSQNEARQTYVTLATSLFGKASSPPASTAETIQTDGDDNSYDDDDDDDDGAVSSAFGAPKVSLPVAYLEDGNDEDSDYDDALGDGAPQSSTDQSPTRRCRKLLSAASKNDVSTLKQLLAEDPALVDASDGSGQTALHMAADRGNVESVELLLVEFKAHVNASDHDGISVLQAAVIAGHVDVCQVLLRHGADPDQEDHDGDTPRSCADDDGSEAMQALFHDGVN